MLPSILAQKLQQGIKDYIHTSFPMTNAPFQGSVARFLAQKDAIYHEPFVSVRLPFRTSLEMPRCFAAVRPTHLPYVHQSKAFERLCGEDGRSTLIATGTGSGKTECFLYPILDYCYRHRGERGIKALMIYPMNALASDQAKRIASLIHENPLLRGNVTVGMYVGGGRRGEVSMGEHHVITDHETMLGCPPDILLTNYKMLDYLLVRPKDAVLWQENRSETLKYIAVDELHTFDGAQGTDLACLLRRLKRRLDIYEGTLCCIGTSATMGSGDSSAAICKYAHKVFGEPFDPDAVITEDRLSAQEFFEGYDATEFAMPTTAEASDLAFLSAQDEPEAYLRRAVEIWFPGFDEDVMSDAGRLALGQRLMHHRLVQSMLQLTGGEYTQISAVREALGPHYPGLMDLPEDGLLSLLSLISHARTGNVGALRPFLNVHVQLWLREWRRFVAKVDREDVCFELSNNLSKQHAHQYLPVVNCRDCGMTGWATKIDESQKAILRHLEGFYHDYFQTGKVHLLFPHDHDERLEGVFYAHLCPECLEVKHGGSESRICERCEVETIDIVIMDTEKHCRQEGPTVQYRCPFCGSWRGLSLMGYRSVNEISTVLSQIFATKFNDDKKTLAFSDNVQDAAHRAGFLNARTWRFGLRTATQKYCDALGAGQTLDQFQKGMVNYWKERLSNEDFVSFFIAPNMIWQHAYEDLLKNRVYGTDRSANTLRWEIEQRMKYEIMLEFGVLSQTGRTLEKSNCCVLSFEPSDIQEIAKRVQERVINELSLLDSARDAQFEHAVIGFLDLLRRNGAFDDDVFAEYLEGRGNNYMLTNKRKSWLPGLQSGRNTPRFMWLSQQQAYSELDVPHAKKYRHWLMSCFPETFMFDEQCRPLGKIVFEEAVRRGIMVCVHESHKIHGLSKERIYVSRDVVQMRCSKCGALHAVSRENVDFWRGAPCLRTHCSGTQAESEMEGLNYYGQLYHAGDLARIVAREHTGLLEKTAREQLELDFKRSKDARMMWDPNVLSCTPTLEMGIDIGDLSSVILCSIPPGQSQFLQRVGRAGRKDGNAFTLTVANARPHDTYFYADPMDMMSGNVAAPKIFLQASAVLERQFLAFCMDCWIKSGIPENAIPDQVDQVLRNLESRSTDMFPFNFLGYVQTYLSRQLKIFYQMFGGELDDGVKQGLETFARGDEQYESTMAIRLIEAFDGLKKQQQTLRNSIKALDELLQNIESKPQDSSDDDEIRNLTCEKSALLQVLHEISHKNIFNFLSDEGLLPNYAFPEAGIMLRAVLTRRRDEEKTKEGAKAAENTSRRQKYENFVYEYNRAAASAISEFAPNNVFYADGHKLTIDQIDLTTAQMHKWRLCPSCSHAQLEGQDMGHAACPQCGNPLWADASQVRSMLKVQLVYSNMDYAKAFINDDNEDRRSTFYCKQLLVDVDESKDVSKAYRMDNDEFAFGYEFVQKAILREINFGESDTTGEKLSVSGIEDVRKGFKICRHCGKLQPKLRGQASKEVSKGIHSFACKTRRNPKLLTQNPYEDCLFLYREFNTEILRMLVPAMTLESTTVRLESFISAFMLGMKAYFGNVDHLRAAVSQLPVSDTDVMKQYLVVYDSVPGGTGYLKELSQNEHALIEVFEHALEVLENCSCKEDPQKDGCYHCLFAYRQSHQIGSISRAVAIQTLQAILSGKEQLQIIPKIADIPIQPLFDSELERRFVEALSHILGKTRFSSVVCNNKHGYHIIVGENKWDVEPQYEMTESDGVPVKCKPDFLLWPESKLEKTHKPVALFLDGFKFHKDKVSDDTLKREAIRRSGRYRVWTLSDKDVMTMFQIQGAYATDALNIEDMPECKDFTMQKMGNETAIDLSHRSPFELLLAYLKHPDAERAFKKMSITYTKALITGRPGLISEESELCHQMFGQMNAHFYAANHDFPISHTGFGLWTPRKTHAHLRIYAALYRASKASKRKPYVCAVLNDIESERSSKYPQEWNGFWAFFNVMQFLNAFKAASQTGLNQSIYSVLPVELEPMPDDLDDLDDETPTEAPDAWDELKDMLDTEAQAIIPHLRTAQIPITEYLGYELFGTRRGVLSYPIELAWPDLRIGIITSEQAAERAAIEANGWTILTCAEVADKGTELAVLFQSVSSEID